MYEYMKKDNLNCQWYKGPEGEGIYVPVDGMMNPLQRARSMA